MSAVTTHGARATRPVALAGLLLLLAACAAPVPAPVLLTLPPALNAAAAPAALPAGAPTLIVRRVNLPEYMVARRVRYRAEASTLAEWPNTYWAERIEVGVSREFVAALRRQLPGWSLCDAGCGEAPAGLALQLDLLTLDFMRADRSLQARARLTLTDGNAPPRVLGVQELPVALPASADSAQAQAQATSDLLRRLAETAAPMLAAARR